MPTATEIIGFVISLVVGTLPSFIILRRYDQTEKRKALADTAAVYQDIAQDCAEDLDKARALVKAQEVYIEQLKRVIRNQGGTPPPFVEPK